MFVWMKEGREGEEEKRKEAEKRKEMTSASGSSLGPKEAHSRIQSGTTSRSIFGQNYAG